MNISSVVRQAVSRYPHPELLLILSLSLVNETRRQVDDDDDAQHPHSLCLYIQSDSVGLVERMFITTLHHRGIWHRLQFRGSQAKGKIVWEMGFLLATTLFLEND